MLYNLLTAIIKETTTPQLKIISTLYYQDTYNNISTDNIIRISMFRSITFVTAMICILLASFTNAFQTIGPTTSIANSRSSSIQLGMIFGE